MKYSKVQYFFWLISGCEINVLKDCPTDYNRQAGIGFTIFMTTLLAFASGSYAGWYFSENYVLAICFGMIWAALIFSIDRSMVITMKKDPTKVKQEFWMTFSSRAIMAILIAAIISIPLELLIFNENIDLNMVKYKLDRTYNVEQAAIRNAGIKSKEGMLRRDSASVSAISQDLAKGEPLDDPEYMKLKQDLQTRTKQYDRLLAKYNSAQAVANRAYNLIPLLGDRNILDENSRQYSNYTRKKNLSNQAKTAYNKFDLKGLNDAKQARDKYIDKWISDNKQEKYRLTQSMKQKSNEIKTEFSKAKSAKEKYKTKIDTKKGFVLRFMVLENLATTKDPVNNPEGGTVLALLWLIRILFFTIEILPTIAKIATPLGAYDLAIYAKEKDFALDLDQKTNDYLAHQKKIRNQEEIAALQQLKQQTEIENKFHKKLLEEVAVAQSEVAMQKVKEFREKHLNII